MNKNTEIDRVEIDPEVREELMLEGKYIAGSIHDGYDKLKADIRAGLIKAYSAGYQAADDEFAHKWHEASRGYTHNDVVKAIEKTYQAAQKSMEADNNRLREALEFYAKGENWRSGGCCFECCGGCNQIGEDGGEKAESALKEE